jgi:outer membrane protein
VHGMGRNDTVRRNPRGTARATLAVAAFLCVCAVASPAGAETLFSALSAAYSSNPDLNAARAGQRATDELVPQALSAWRPQIFGSANYQNTTTNVPILGTTNLNSGAVGVTVSQYLFRGFQTVNNTKAAEATVQAGRASLDNTEQNTLFGAAQAYMNVLTGQAIVELNKQNIEVLAEQLRATRDRFQVGEVTNTDVAQAEAALSGAYTQLNAAEANLLSAKAVYRQIIGRDPVNLAPAGPAGRLPPTLDQALIQAHASHPAIIASIYAEEAAAYQVKTAEGTLLPTLSLQGSAEYDKNPSAILDHSSAASITAQLTIPIYQGGLEYSQVREAKESRTQATLQIDSARQQVRAAVVSAWGTLEAATASIKSAQAQVKAAQIALDGVREEAKVGQRTTLDVLDAEQTLLDGRVSLVTAESDRVVASYALLSAIGSLTAQSLALAVEAYQPQVHYEQVRDKWFGLRTPSGQ